MLHIDFFHLETKIFPSLSCQLTRGNYIIFVFYFFVMLLAIDDHCLGQLGYYGLEN